MANFITGKCVTNIDNVDLSHIKGFSCKPQKGEYVSVILNGKPAYLEVCDIRHVWERTHEGHVPVLEVELTAKKAII